MLFLIIWQIADASFAATPHNLEPSWLQDSHIGIGLLLSQGNSLYQIGGQVETPTESGTTHFPLSELKFPLALELLQLTWQHRWKEKLVFGAALVTSPGESYAGKMEDSDWGVVVNDADSLDIYSLSDSQLNYLQWDIYAEILLLDSIGWQSSIQLGYRRWNLAYRLYNLDQWYPSRPTRSHDTQPGLVLTYQVDYSLPYGQLNITRLWPGGRQLIISGYYSPLATAEDYDNHLLRSKKSWSSASGYGSGIGARWQTPLHSSPVLFAASYDYNWIYTEGYQNQYIEGDWLGQIQNRIVLSQWIMRFELILNF